MGAGEPVTLTLKLEVVPVVTVWLKGCVMIAGAVVVAPPEMMNWIGSSGPCPFTPMPRTIIVYDPAWAGVPEIAGVPVLSTPLSGAGI